VYAGMREAHVTWRRDRRNEHGSLPHFSRLGFGADRQQSADGRGYPRIEPLSVFVRGSCRRDVDQPAGNVRVFVEVMAGADAVVSVCDSQVDPRGKLPAHEEDW
jgi:hypothetical protein